jgi:hypothetical protein
MWAGLPWMWTASFNWLETWMGQKVEEGGSWQSHKLNFS